MTDILQARDRDVIWHPYEAYGSPPPIPVARGSGAYLETTDGKNIIDGISSWWVTIHGHSHPKITEAVTKQLHILHQVIFSGFTHEPAVKLAERLLSVLPSNQKKIFYSDNGSTAVEVALKLSIQYWANRGTPRSKVVCLSGGYHGDTFGAMATSERGYFVAPFEKLLFETISITSPADNPEKAIDELRDALTHNDVACFIFEPLVQGAGGMKIYSEDTLSQLLTLAKAHGVPCIADEVMTGFGRLGTWFATSRLTSQPDIICLSKGLTGGTLPMGVTSCSEEIFNAFKSSEKTKTFFHGHSFTANPLAAAAANASFEIMSEPETWNSICRISQRHEAFAATLRHHPKVNNVRSMGTILAFDITSQLATSYLNPIKDNFIAACLSRGVFLRPLGNIVYVMPPYIISDDALMNIYEVILQVLDEVA